jgi:Fur family transcriptional regulator, ferric uptake regulator
MPGMTMASQGRRVTAERLPEALAFLREHGVRLTGSRRAVLQALFADATPRTAEEIAARAYVDLASAYRNLDTLEQLGIVRHVHLGHGPGLYARVSRQQLEHAVCDVCGEHRSVPAVELEAARDAIRRATGITASFAHFPIVGRCATCA